MSNEGSVKLVPDWGSSVTGSLLRRTMGSGQGRIEHARDADKGR